jgi:ribonuclease HII
MRIVGIDEVGRGCLAGPVVASAVLLDTASSKILEKIHLTDSKCMTMKQREAAYDSIVEHALAYGIGWSSHQDVDSFGLTHAIALAMQQALDAIKLEYSRVIIDGNYNFLPSNIKVITKIKADATEISVSAASILAKVARDRFMKEQAAIYPQYGFEKHVGYGTKLHLSALKTHGPSRIHRYSVKPVALYSTIL